MSEPKWPKPTTEPADEDLLRRLNPWRVTRPPNAPGLNGPDCIWCNAPTQRTGSCFTCINCGATTSC